MAAANIQAWNEEGAMEKRAPLSGSECDSVLITRTKIDKLDTKVSMSWLKMVTQDNYKEAKASAGGSYGDMFDGEWSDFKKERDALEIRENFDYKMEVARSVIQTGVPEDAVRAWSECMADRSEGLFCLVRRVEEDVAVIAVIFRYSGDTNLVNRTSHVVGGTILEDQFTKDPDDPFEGTALITIQRDKTKDIVLTVGGKRGGGTVSDEAYVPKDLLPPKKTYHEHDFGAAVDFSWEVPRAARARELKVWFGSYHHADEDTATCWATFRINNKVAYKYPKTGYFKKGTVKALGNSTADGEVVPAFEKLNVGGYTDNERATIVKSLVIVEEPRAFRTAEIEEAVQKARDKIRGTLDQKGERRKSA